MSTKKEKWNFENLICKLPHCRCMQQFPCSNHHYSDECFSTNDHSKSESIEWKEALDSFIKKWVPGSYAHLSDNDENDGERLRTAIQDAITTAVEAREREISEAVDIVGIDCGCVLGKCKMCASIDFIKSEILSFITTAVAKRELDIADEVEKIKTYTGGSSVNEKDKRVNKAEVLSILKH